MKPGAAVVLTGIHTGVVNVAVRVLHDPPPELETEGWEEVADVSIESPGGTLRVTALMGEVPSELPLLTPAGPGHYRLRVHARGRDTAPDGTASDPFEDYLLVVWPAPASPPVIHKQSDRYGDQWRRYTS